GGNNSTSDGDMTASFDGTVAVVTGGGSGLGEAIGKLLARSGRKVVVTDLDPESDERVAGEITSAGGTALAAKHDTAKPEDSERVVKLAVDTFGALNHAVNNAGIGGAQEPAGETDIGDWNRVIAVNLYGVLYGIRYQICDSIVAG